MLSTAARVIRRHRREHREGEGHDRQGERSGGLGQGGVVREVGHGGQPAQLHREEHDQQGGDEELGTRDQPQGADGDAPVVESAGVHRREEPEHQSERNRDGCGCAAEQQRAGQTDPDDVRDLAASGERFAEVAREEARQPLEVAHRRGTVEAEIAADRSNRLFGSALAEHRFGDIAGQDLGAREHQNRDHEQSQDSEDEPAHDELEHPPILRRPRAGAFGQGCARAALSTSRRPRGNPAPRSRSAIAAQRHREEAEHRLFPHPCFGTTRHRSRDVTPPARPPRTSVRPRLR